MTWEGVLSAADSRHQQLPATIKVDMLSAVKQVKTGLLKGLDSLLPAGGLSDTSTPLGWRRIMPTAGMPRAGTAAEGTAAARCEGADGGDVTADWRRWHAIDGDIAELTVAEPYDALMARTEQLNQIRDSLLM